MNQGYAESRIPTATGAGQEFAHVNPLYNVAAITIAAFFGTPLAAAALIATNFRRLGQPEKAKTALLAGLGVTVMALVIGHLVPQSLSLPIGIGLLMGVRGAAQSQQGPILDKHFSQGGPFESRWKALGISLIFLAASCAIIFGVAAGAAYISMDRSKIRVGSHCEVYYSGSASKQDAESLGKALQQLGFASSKGASIRLSKENGATAVAFAVKEGFWDEAGIPESFEEIGRQIAPSVGGFPITVRLTNVAWETKKELMVGRLLTDSHLEIFYLGTASEAEAKSLAKALEGEGFVSDHKLSLFLTKGGGVPAMTFIVRNGWWEDPTHVSEFEQLVRKIAPSVGGLPIKLRLANENVEIKKESLVQGNG